MLPEPYLFRARASIALHDATSAARDLDEGIAIAEKQSGDAGPAPFEEAIRLQLDRGDIAKAFAYVERARAQPAADVASLQRRLARSGTTVVEYVIVRPDIVAFTIDERGLRATRTPMTASREFATLYDVLVAPLNLDARRLIVLPDSHLGDVPFAALYDRRAKQYLVERMPISIALSASSLQRVDVRAPRSVLAVALPAGAALPESEREMLEVRALYRQSTTVPPTFAAFTSASPRADVVHTLMAHSRRGTFAPKCETLRDSCSRGRTLQLSCSVSATMMPSGPRT